MTLNEAIEVGQSVHAGKRLTLIAIGRFCQVAALTGLEERWGVSIRVGAADKPKVVWSREEFTRLCESLQPPKTRKRPKVEETQYTLF
jgi:hypothetical protein